MAIAKGIWPPPVYVATFAGGETIRMSYWSRAGKPLDHDAGRRYVQAAIGRERARRPAWHDLPRGFGCSPQALQESGYFESVEYRQVLRFFAQRLVDACITELCGTPMPITTWRRLARNAKGLPMRDRDGKWRWITARRGYDSVPLFRTHLPPAATPATDIISGHTGLKDTGEIIPDPFFAAADNNVVAFPKRAVKTPLEKAMALLGKLSDADRAVLREALGERVAA